jgi:hypothetical protein
VAELGLCVPGTGLHIFEQMSMGYIECAIHLKALDKGSFLGGSVIIALVQYFFFLFMHLRLSFYI